MTSSPSFAQVEFVSSDLEMSLELRMVKTINRLRMGNILFMVLVES